MADLRHPWRALQRRIDDGNDRHPWLTTMGIALPFAIASGIAFGWSDAAVFYGTGVLVVGLTRERPGADARRGRTRGRSPDSN